MECMNSRGLREAGSNKMRPFVLVLAAQAISKVKQTNKKLTTKVEVNYLLSNIHLFTHSLKT